MAVEMVEYDEFGLFHENAAEYGIPYDGPPTVRREDIRFDDGRHLSALVWGDAEPELVFLHGGAQNAHTWDTVALALGRPLVCIDLPGHGHSGPPADATTDCERMPRTSMRGTVSSAMMSQSRENWGNPLASVPRNRA